MKFLTAEFIRYACVGCFNTIVGYGTFAFFTKLLTPVVPYYPYVVANLAASVFSISVAFLGYKWFVFRTKGNYLKEWVRCLMVYSGGIVLSSVLLAPAVGLLRYWFHLGSSAPYIAGAIIIGGTAVISFFGHKHISFRPSKNPA